MCDFTDQQAINHVLSDKIERLEAELAAKKREIEVLKQPALVKQRKFKTAMENFYAAPYLKGEEVDFTDRPHPL